MHLGNYGYIGKEPQVIRGILVILAIAALSTTVTLACATNCVEQWWTSAFRLALIRSGGVRHFGIGFGQFQLLALRGPG